ASSSGPPRDRPVDAGARSQTGGIAEDRVFDQPRPLHGIWNPPARARRSIGRYGCARERTRHLESDSFPHRPYGHRRHRLYFAKRGTDGLWTIQRSGRYRKELMKFIRYSHHDETSVGLISGDGIAPIAEINAKYGLSVPNDLLRIIEQGSVN